MDRFADDGKLGQGFTLADDLVEVDICNGDKPRPTLSIREIGPDCRSSIGLPLLLIVGVGSLTC